MKILLLLAEMKYEPVMTMGNVITICTFLLSWTVTVIVMWVKLGTRVEAHGKWIEKHDEEMIRRTEIMAELKNVVVRLTTLFEGLERRLSRLEERDNRKADLN